jgi:adenylate cyclase
VGDEAVITWPLRKGLRYAVCARCFFAIQKQIKRYSSYYQKRYGRVPAFKAALHGGTVVVSEVGKYKSEIAYHGDVLNTTARMLGKCHELGAELLVSDFIFEKVEMPKYLLADPVGECQLRGKQQVVNLYSVILSPAKELLQVRRKRLIGRQKAKLP